LYASLAKEKVPKTISTFKTSIPRLATCTRIVTHTPIMTDEFFKIFLAMMDPILNGRLLLLKSRLV
jgi:hypothetical protein